MVGVRFQPDQLAALDAFIAEQPRKVSRPEAIRAFVAAGLSEPNAQTQASTDQPSSLRRRIDD
jgi:hypothetical protein